MQNVVPLSSFVLILVNPDSQRETDNFFLVVTERQQERRRCRRVASGHNCIPVPVWNRQPVSVFEGRLHVQL